MTRVDAVLLAGYTSRSQAYVQALAAASLAPSEVLLYGDPERENLGAAARVLEKKTVGDLPIPDSSIPVEETCNEAGWPITRISASSVNAEEVAAHLDERSPRLVIYSGYGGQIIRPHVLALSEFLHVHSGWLPDERGSTTMYYGMLKGTCCGVSALFLRERIDEGPVVARRRYPAPPPGFDADHLYDGAIRADLLRAVLMEYAEKGRLPEARQYGELDGTTYYVIHPVLKHVALLSRRGHGD